MSFTDMMLPHSFYKEKVEVCHAVYSYWSKKKKKTSGRNGGCNYLFQPKKDLTSGTEH